MVNQYQIIPVVPHKAVAEVLKTGNYRGGESEVNSCCDAWMQSEYTDGGSAVVVVVVVGAGFGVVM